MQKSAKLDGHSLSHVQNLKRHHKWESPRFIDFNEIWERQRNIQTLSVKVITIAKKAETLG